MDQNKVKKLQEVGFRILPTCSRCKYGRFATSNNFFGTCAKFTYDHQKHSQNPRQLSVHSSGSCEFFETHPLETIEKWEEFIVGDRKLLRGLPNPRKKTIKIR